MNIVMNTKYAAHHRGVAPVLCVVSTLCYEDVTLKDKAKIHQQFVIIFF